MRRESIPLAVTYSLLASFTYATLAFLVKKAEDSLSPPILVFYRQLFGLLLLMPIIPFKLGSYRELKTKVFPLHLLRVFASIASMFCLYYSLYYLPLIDAVLLTYTRPLFIPFVVYFWFRKKWTRNTWVGLLVGFLGVVLILRPDNKIFDVASIIAIGAAFFGSIAFTTIRRLTKTEPAERITFYYMAVSIPIAAFPLVMHWETPTVDEWWLLALISAVAVVYQLFLARAYRHAKAVKVGSLLYFSVAFAYLYDLVFGEVSLPLTAFVGVALIVVGSIVAIREVDN